MNRPPPRLGDPLIIDGWFQGPTGRGQGGWTAARVAERIGQPVTVWLRAPVPLDVELSVVEVADRWECRHRDTLVLDATPWTPDTVDTEPVSIEAAREGRTRFVFADHDHPVPDCFSCGIRAHGMGVHPGPLLPDREPDGEVRVATDWTVPEWAVDRDGTVDPGALWAALDCTSAFYACCHPVMRPGFTASYAVDVLRPVAPGETLALVGWRGDSDGAWHGRKRGAASAAFDAHGNTVARTRSLWIAVE